MSVVEDNMPWIVAFVFVNILIVVVNILIAILQHNSNRKSIDKQLQNAKDTTNKQIENAKEIAILDFNRSVKSGNRQEWINSVRDTSSELIANLESFNHDFINAKLIDGVVEFKRKNQYTFEISRLGTKLELLLNPEEEKTEKALLHLGNMSKKIIHNKKIDENYIRNEYKADEEKFLKVIQSILKEEWERVKAGN